ncbi:MAG: DNA-processing protein DprA [Reichenbachiella sp.]
MKEQELLYVLALKEIQGIGDVLAKQLISYCGSAEAIFKSTKGKLRKIPNIGAKTIEGIGSKESLKKAEISLENCIKQGISVIPYFHRDFPEKLNLVNDAPLLIFHKGNVCYNNRKVIGIVGTRNATEYGKEMTTEIVKGLVPHDAVIVSGLAYGIDIAAHRASLKSNLSTVGVLAGGLDRVYPAAHRKSAEEMLMNGSLIAEQAPGVKPEPHFFPARNRIIAGMSDLVIVVEAANKGGALITGNIAHSYNREVFAVPGQLDHRYSEGCNALIRSQRANIYTRVEDLEYLMNWEKGEKKVAEISLDLSQLSEDEKVIVMLLQNFKDGLQLDELSWKSNLPINTAASVLLNLEFSGLVKSLPGKKYKLWT